MGQITFATLGSQDVAPSEKEAEDCSSQGEMEPRQESDGLSAPTPGAVAAEACSPRSVYCLANKVRLVSLRSKGYGHLQHIPLGRVDWTLRCCLQGY